MRLLFRLLFETSRANFHKISEKMMAKLFVYVSIEVKEALFGILILVGIGIFLKYIHMTFSIFSIRKILKFLLKKYALERNYLKILQKLNQSTSKNSTFRRFISIQNIFYECKNYLKTNCISRCIYVIT